MKPNIKNIKGAAQAIRNNPRKAKYEMRDSMGGRCCLCVMMDYAEEQGADVKQSEDNDLPAREGMEQFYGIKTMNNLTEQNMFDFILQGSPASHHNDGVDIREKTHEEIADMIEKEFIL